MHPTPATVDLGTGAAIAAIGALLATLAVAIAWWRGRANLTHQEDPVTARAQRQHGLLLLTLFLTFDLVVFGAYTRLSDSGLGCPDWPGCYASVSPVGAQAHIDLAQAALPSGPVTHHKAWIEMVHRYLATAVGALITLIMALAWWQRGRTSSAKSAAATTIGVSPSWATLCFVWVCLQGAFGAFTVTMKLYPAIVTLHLLGGVGLLALLAVAARHSSLALQARVAAPVPAANTQAAKTTSRDEHAALAAHRPLLLALLALLIAQTTLGGWVSTNYAVLACSDFPTCHGGWWPETDFRAGFTVLRHLGHQADGSLLPLPALTAIHLVHRLGAIVVLLAAALAAWRLRNAAITGWPRRALLLALGLLGLQILTGISNVVLGWPLLAALAHTGGAAALLALLAALLASARPGRPVSTSRSPDR
jgi:cytochrome c oxidase assembly protein subunit 15